MKKCIIMAGGTGGHVFPGLAVAAELKKSGLEVIWLGSPRGLEQQLVPSANIPLHTISISGLRGRGQWGWLVAPLRLLRAVIQAVKIFRREKPSFALGLGGFASGPGGIAAWLTGTPLVIHEQNAIAGLTNRYLAKLARVTLAAFPKAFNATKLYQTREIPVTGNPVREDLKQLSSPAERFASRVGPLRLLILGGSRGALAINEMLPRAIAAMPPNSRPIVWHQSGANNLEVTQKLYQQFDRANNVEAKVEPFINNVAEAYQWADLVLCRAGALTIAELAMVGIGSILVPYPHAVDDHQTANAKSLVEAGAAILVQQTDLTPEYLSELLQALTQDRQNLLSMAEAASSLATPEAPEIIARYCLETAGL